jgi:tol-pal system protein YbgF
MLNARRALPIKPVAKLAVWLVLVTSAWFVPAAMAREPAPVIEGGATATASSGNLENRLERLERRLDSGSMMEMITRLDQMQQELQRLNGNIEVLNHEIESIKKRQRELYVDLDRRISQVEQKTAELAKAQQSGAGVAMVAPGPSGPAGGGGGQAGNAGSDSGTAVASVSRESRQLEREAYERAFNLLREGRYELAIASFKAYLETYPQAEFADNAQYWLGEANYAQGRYDDALKEFNRVLDNYPNSGKRADAMLKMGFSYQEIGKKDDAIAVLGNIVKMFPDTTAARLAQKRLQSLKGG